MPTATQSSYLSTVAPQFHPDPRRAGRLSAAKLDAEVRHNIGEALAGYTFGRSLAVNVKSMTATTPDEVVQMLRGGVTLTVTCYAGSGNRRIHRLTFAPDGAVVMHHHPDVDMETERVLGALGNGMPPCLMVADRIPTGTPIPSGYRLGKQTLDLRLRALYTAVAWAQEPDPDWSMVKDLDLCGLGITPSLMRQWHEAGFSTEQALRFWQERATLENALPWLAAGRVTQAAAKQARRGRTPDGQTPWRQAGFADAQALGWQRDGLSPDTAARLRDAGFSVTTARSALNPRHAYQRTRPTVDEVIEIAQAGVAPNEVGDFWDHSHGNKAEILAWGSAGFRAYEYWVLAHPFPGVSALGFMAVGRSPQSGAPATPVPLTLDEALAWRDAGYPMSQASLLPEAKAAGLAPDMWGDFDVPAAQVARYAVIAELQDLHRRLRRGRV